MKLTQEHAREIHRLADLSKHFPHSVATGLYSGDMDNIPKYVGVDIEKVQEMFAGEFSSVSNIRNRDNRLIILGKIVDVQKYLKSIKEQSEN